jgi:hypothetical protein
MFTYKHLIILISFVFCFSAESIAEPLHDGHEWLKDKRNGQNIRCCNDGDCKPVPAETIIENKNGSYDINGYNLPRVNVFPTEDELGRPFLCVDKASNHAYCAFIPYST